MARIILQNDKANDKVSNIYYVVRGLFQKNRGTCRGGYIVRKLNKPNSLEFKLMSEDIYILPRSLKPFSHVDNFDTRYLNQYHIPIVNSLKKP